MATPKVLLGGFYEPSFFHRKLGFIVFQYIFIVILEIRESFSCGVAKSLNRLRGRESWNFARPDM